MTADEVEQVAFNLDWSGADGVEPRLANQFVVQLAPPSGSVPDGVYLLVGDVTPPLVVSKNPEFRQAELDRYDGKLPVRVHGRYFLTRGRLEELRTVLDELARQFDEEAALNGEEAT